MPRPSAPGPPAGAADHEGRHRRRRQVRRDAWEEWDDLVGVGVGAGEGDPARAGGDDRLGADGEDPARAGGDDRLGADGEDPARAGGHDRLGADGEDPARAGGHDRLGGDEGGSHGVAAGREAHGEEVRVFTVPASLRSVDVRVGGRAVRGMLLLAAVVLLVLGGRWWWVAQGAGAEPVPAVPVTAETVGGSLDQGAGTSGPAQGSTVPAGTGETGRPVHDERDGHGGSAPDVGVTAGDITVVVHVVGEVSSPGVVELPAGSRVADAVAAAGGLTSEADQMSLNLARALVDGEQVWVGAPGEEPPPGVAQGAAGGIGTQGGSGGQAPAAPGEPAPPPLLDLNRATQAELEGLPGVGPVTAERILAWREQHGRFSVVEELMEVSGIGERTFAQLQPLVTAGG